MPHSFKTLTCLLIVFSFLICTHSSAQLIDNKAGIIPAPASLKQTDGQFVLSNNTVIRTDSTSNKTVKFLISYLSENYKLKNKLISTSSGLRGNGSTVIDIITKSKANLPQEGYQLNITPQKILLTGNGAGLFYGIQTLLQLFPEKLNAHYALPCMNISDYPRFKYRGLMLDVSRHFFNVNEVKQVIDLMAQYKLNTFHWHLTDNEGWRIEIKKYPKLTSVGGYNVNTVLDADRDGLDSISTGGFYTQEQIKEVVKYASDRFITTVPEIEMPAHSGAALRSYPAYKCVLPAGSANLAANNIIYCPTEQTFKFLEDILTEVIPLFPGKYIHIGGDEANKKPWEESAYCQELIKKLNLKDVHELQSYFIQRIEKFLNSKNRSIIGWDEILEGGLAQNATVMSWRGESGGIAAAQQKHKVIMTPGPNGLYFDHYQSNSNSEPQNHEPGYGGYAPLTKTYGYDPVPASLTAAEKEYVWGVQANIWAEHIPTMNKLEYMILPRIFALSEVAWTLPENKNLKSFLEISVPKHLNVFEKRGHDFRVQTAFNATDTVMIGSRFILANKSTVMYSKTYYTLNGHTPTEIDREYKEPLKFFIPKNERRELQTVVISQTGKRSVPTRSVMYNYDPFPAAQVGGLKAGVRYWTYQLDPLDTVRVHSTIASGILPDFHIDSLKKRTRFFRIVYEGYMNVGKDGIYNFNLAAKNHNRLFIDGHNIIVDNTNFSRYENVGAAPLQKGYHKFRLEYTSDNNLMDIPVYFQVNGGERHKITADMLFY